MELEDQLQRAEALVAEETGSEYEWSARRRRAAAVERLERAAAVEWEAKLSLLAALDQPALSGGTASPQT